MIILRFDFEKNELMFSGANNSVYQITDNTLNEIKGDKIPVGLYHEELKPYTASTLNIKKGDRIFATTDGLPDQFGGEKGKKFMYKRLENIILQNQSKSMLTLKQNLIVEFDNWKGENEQVDDITFLGIEI